MLIFSYNHSRISIHKYHASKIIKSYYQAYLHKYIAPTSKRALTPLESEKNASGLA